MRVLAKSLSLVGALAVAFVIVLLTTFAGAASGQAQHARWDIIRLSITATSTTILAGGAAEAKTPDPAATFGPIDTIRLTGTGTFVAPSGGGKGSGAVTGGGTWSINGGAGGSGSYVAEELVSWESAGFWPVVPLIDGIGNPNERSNGTAVIRITFSDGDSGVLTIGCHGPGAPPHIFEGIAVTKAFETFYDVQNPGADPNLNRTIFHVRR